MFRLLIVAVAAALTPAAHAQTDYPSRSIRVITVASAGSGTDAITRLFATKMGPILKTNFVVDNRPAAGGALAMEAVAKSPPDGYTIALGGFSASTLLPIVRSKLSYDPIKDFEPIGQIGTAAILMVAANDVPANNVKELIAYAKASPNGLMYASWGIGSTGHFCGELLNQRGGIKMTHVPYKGVAPVVNDLLGGQVRLALVDMPTGSPLVKSGRVKAIGSCVTRSPSLPDVRGFSEDGIDFSGKSALAPMFAYYAPAGTPQPILDKLGMTLKQVVEMPDVAAKLLELGVTPDFVPGGKYRTLLTEGIPQWREIAVKSNIKADD